MLDALMQQLAALPVAEVDQLQILLPTRRAVLTLQRGLVQAGCSWLPGIDTLHGWLEGCVELPVADPLACQLLIWEAANRPVPFSLFRPEAALLQQLYEEVDGSLNEIAGVAELLPDAELAQDHAGPLKHFEQLHLDTLARTAHIYTRYKALLAQQQRLDKGQVLRQVAERPAHYLPTQPVWLVAPDRLGKAERNILMHLASRAQLRIFWELDAYYLQPTHHSAGHLYRSVQAMAPALAHSALPVGRRLAEAPYGVQQQACATDLGQVYALGAELHRRVQSLQQQQPTTWADTLSKWAVVLPDETLLPTLLEALPAVLPAVNVSMGYPARACSLHALLHSWQQLHQGRKPEGFYHSPLLQLLRHPLLQLLAGKESQSLVNNTQQYNRIYSWPRTQHPLLASLLRPIDTAADWLSHTPELLGLLNSLLPQSASYDHAYLAQAQLRAGQLKQLATGQPLDAKSLGDLFIHLLGQDRLAFAPTAGKGLQVIGLLETRAMDFEEVFMLSVQEGSLPPSPRPDNLLSPSVRTRLGMHTPEDLEGQYSYVFWRLLAQARRIHLFYTENEAEGITASRYLAQVRLEWRSQNPQVQLHSLRPHLGATGLQPQPIVLNPERSWRLARLTRSVANDEEALPTLSPTALNQYQACSLQFAFRYLYGLKPAEAVDEDPDQRVFGLVLHKALELLYAPWQGQYVTAEQLAAMAQEPTLDSALKQACLQVQPDAETAHGKLSLDIGIIRHLVRAVLQQDEQRAPFRLIDLEQSLNARIRLGEDATIRLYGTADRVEEQAGRVHILDYKTGKLDEKKAFVLKVAELEPGAALGKQALQGLVYAWLYASQHGGGQLPEVGFYKLKARLPEIQTLEMNELDHRLLNEYLARLLEKMLSEPYAQTPDKGTCTYCDYVGICQRDSVSS
ncbi:MAG: PD-(D/E)XK nuclease family protein [Bacteroidetes bacterium]|nr:PD-(D/E)XK nuclease family protein [Bacteroidota bacterium]